jgi:acyl-CoA thioesterase-1
LESRLVKRGIQAQVINAGRSGDTTAQGLRRLDWNLKQGPFDLVILALGANDGLRRMDLNTMRSNLDSMITKFKQNKSQVLLCGMRLPLNFDPTYRKRFEAIYPELAKKHQIPLVPFLLEDVALSSELNLNDLIHPNAKGHELIADRLVDQIYPLVKK